MSLVKRVIGGVEYAATEVQWSYVDFDATSNGCGVSLEVFADKFPSYEDIIEAVEKFRKYGTTPLGVDFTIACLLHDTAFLTKDQSLEECNKTFTRNLHAVRVQGKRSGWRVALAKRWTWYDRFWDGNIRRIIRLYRLLVDTVGIIVWETK